jgi:hypothetical protein
MKYSKTHFEGDSGAGGWGLVLKWSKPFTERKEIKGDSVEDF